MKQNDDYRIFIVDDEPDLAALLKYQLEKRGFFCELINDPGLFVTRARQFEPHLIILDIIKPGSSGIQLCRLAQSDPSLRYVPVIFISTLNETSDRIGGLEAGAEDYISKPFNTDELELRIRNILYRYSKISRKKRIQIGPVVLNDELRQLLVDGRETILTVNEFYLLKTLMEKKTRVQSRQALLESVWKQGDKIELRTVDTFIRRIRQKLEPYGHMIETVRGVGYRSVDI